MLYINKDITIRALNPGRAILDGESAARALHQQWRRRRARGTEHHEEAEVVMMMER